MRRAMRQCVTALGLCGLAGLLCVSAEVRGASPWTDPADPTLPADFKIQGEYVGTPAGGGKLGAQVIALSGGAFQAVLYPGGLPGAGWDGKARSLLQGKLDGDKAVFEPASGNRKYLAGPAGEFSATSKFPPDGHQPATGTIAGDVFAVKIGEGAAIELKKTVRQSDSIGAKPPQGARVLFDGTDLKEWTGGRLDEKTKLLNTDGKDILTKRKFTDYTMHVEFLLPYKPEGRGQGRGNSGFYQADLYEVQILDSFGLDGKSNECGGIYTQQDPKVNMCLPPLVWQTYDVDFTSAVVDSAGKKVKPARLTVRLNGVVIHEDYELKGKTGGSRNDPEGTPGPIKLQGHGNPLQFRNVWIVEKKAG